MNERFTRAGLCFFRSGGRRFAMEVEALMEVTDLGTLVPLPLGPPALLGLHTHRRAVVPVFRPSPAAPNEHSDQNPILLVLRSEHGLWGIEVDRAGLMIVDNSRLLEGLAPADSTAGLLAVRGQIDHAGLLHELIDAGLTWSNIRVEVERWYVAIRRDVGAVALAS